MSLKTVTIVVCDHDGCKASASEHGEYVAWMHPDAGPYEDADGAGWLVTLDADYCEDHRAEHESEDQ